MHIWEQLTTDQCQIVPRQASVIFCLMILSALVVLRHVCCLWLTGVVITWAKNRPFDCSVHQNPHCLRYLFYSRNIILKKSAALIKLAKLQKNLEVFNF